MHRLLLLQKIMATCQKINQLRCVFGATIGGTSLIVSRILSGVKSAAARQNGRLGGRPRKVPKRLMESFLR